MTIEEAIKILDPETTREALSACSTKGEAIRVVDEACETACTALCAQMKKEKNEPLNGWVSVKDRLPDVGQYVICIAKRNPFSSFMPMIARIVKNGWVNPVTEQYISKATYWMTLPEPPKEDEYGTEKKKKDPLHGRRNPAGG